MGWLGQTDWKNNGRKTARTIPLYFGSTLAVRVVS